MTISPIRFVASTYVDRVNDAICVQLGETYVYYATQKVIAVVVGGAMYRIEKLDTGVVYKRIRHAMLKHKPTKIHQMERADLNALVEAAIMKVAAKLVDERMGIETE